MSQSTHNLSVDFSQFIGEIRPLNGVNNGPLNMGGLTDLSPYHVELKIPFTRLHDPHWPNPDVVDINAVFPKFDADQQNADAYEFGRTDEYIEAIVKLGSQIIYRLGHGIEHTHRKYHTAPPSDYQKWAQICIGIIRHYNEGWAGGHRFGIRHWEIWNEPDISPTAASPVSPTWAGGWVDYFRLYAVAASMIKSHDPQLMVGGPAMTGNGVNSGFLAAFLDYCRDNTLPLDFCSWHDYTSQVQEIVGLAISVRKLLNEHGYTHTLSNLNEWNYIPPGMDWGVLFKPAFALQRKQINQEISGIRGAVFDASVLICLQDCPVDIANYYLADTLPYFSMFDIYGLPLKAFFAFKAFRHLLDTPLRVMAAGNDLAAGVCIGAGMARDGTSATILACDRREGECAVQLTLNNLPGEHGWTCNHYILDSDNDLSNFKSEILARGIAKTDLRCIGPAVHLLKLTPA